MGFVLSVPDSMDSPMASGYGVIQLADFATDVVLTSVYLRVRGNSNLQPAVFRDTFGPRVKIIFSVLV